MEKYLVIILDEPLSWLGVFDTIEEAIAAVEDHRNGPAAAGEYAVTHILRYFPET